MFFFWQIHEEGGGAYKCLWESGHRVYLFFNKWSTVVSHLSNLHQKLLMINNYKK